MADIIIDLKENDASNVHLTMKIKSVSSKDANKECVMHSKSNNKEFEIYDKTHNIVGWTFQVASFKIAKWFRNIREEEVIFSFS